MRRLRLVAICLLAALTLSPAVRADTYYLANAGDDAQSGRSPEAAWRTLARAREVARAGDTILLRRGDIFREGADFSGKETAGMTFSAWGPQDAPNPVISGGVPITGWQPHGNGIYVASVDGPIEHLFVDGKLMTIARYPNSGWLRVIGWGPAEGGNTVITCPELAENPRNAPGYWDGAQVRWRRWSWLHETRRVAGYDGKGGLTLEGPPGDWDPFWSGFYMDDKLEELDAPGEWYFDDENLRIYLYPPDGADPNTLQVEGSRLEEGLTVSDSTVEGITFRHQTRFGLHIQGRSTVRGCRFEGINGQALYATWSVRNAVVRDCVFEDNINNAIVWNEWPQNGGSSLIEGNVFLNTGMVPGYEPRKSWHAVAICVYNGSNIRIRRNIIDGTGYSGMYIGGDANIIENNNIARAMWTMNDGAGIYVNANRTVIRHNIILDTLGSLESSHRIPYGGVRDYEHSWPWANLGHGIWIEFLSDFRGSIVEGNTCAGCGGSGLFLSNNFESVVRGNVFYNNARAQVTLGGFETYERTHRSENIPQNHRIESNVFFAAAEGQAAITFRPQFDYGFFAGNYICSPYSEKPVSVYGTGAAKWTQTPVTIGEWQERFSWADRRPVTDLTRPGEAEEDFSRLIINDSDELRDVPLGEGIWHDLDGRILTGSIPLAPYTSAVVVRCTPGDLVPTQRQAPAAGRLAWVGVAAEAGTQWRAESEAEWIVIEGEAEGQGIGAVRYKVMPNPDPAPRTGTLTVNGRTHTIVQAGADR